MLSKKVMISNPKLVAIVKKCLSVLVLFICSFILSSCNIFDLIPTADSQLDDNEIYEIINEISLEVMPANLTIYAQGYRSSLGLGVPDVSNQGSGVIFYDDGNYYYFMTCNHVIYMSNEYNHKKYKVVDYKNNEYLARYVFAFNDYDLAIFRIPKTRELAVMEFADSNPELGSLVFSIGQPGNQHNTITVGKISKYDTPNCEDCDPKKSNVDFDCIYHNATISHGSSGGMLIDQDQQIVGINTFGSLNSEHGIAVPVLKITEFIELAIKLNAFSMTKNE